MAGFGHREEPWTVLKVTRVAMTSFAIPKRTSQLCNTCDAVANYMMCLDAGAALVARQGGGEQRTWNAVRYRVLTWPWDPGTAS